MLCNSACLPLAWQAAVLGVSCHHDVQECMEKRVRSRFSNRKLVVPPLASSKEGAASQVGLVMHSHSTYMYTYVYPMIDATHMCHVD